MQSTQNENQSLSDLHILGAAKNVNKRQLATHLIFYHGVGLGEAKTQLQLGKLHLLAHAVTAFPELGQLMGLPERWGHS